jgi:hypothetical protein
MGYQAARLNFRIETTDSLPIGHGISEPACMLGFGENIA